MLRLPAPSSQAQPRLAWPMRLILLYVGAVLPAVCFALSHGGLHLGSTGRLGRLAESLLEGAGTGPFYPLILFSIGCWLLSIFRPQDAAVFPVRLGIYSGVLLAAQYSLIMGGVLVFHLRLSPLGALGVAVAALAVPIGLGRLFRRLRQSPAGTRILREAFWLGVIGVILLSSIALVPTPRGPDRVALTLVVLACGGSLICAPFWALGGYAWMARRLGSKSWPTRARERLWSWLFWGLACWAAGQTALEQALQAAGK
jgi:hypothetical protein